LREFSAGLSTSLRKRARRILDAKGGLGAAMGPYDPPAPREPKSSDRSIGSSLAPLHSRRSEQVAQGTTASHLDPSSVDELGVFPPFGNTAGQTSLTHGSSASAG